MSAGCAISCVEELGDLPCSISSEVSPLAKEYARASTTVVDTVMQVEVRRVHGPARQGPPRARLRWSAQLRRLLGSPAARRLRDGAPLPVGRRRTGGRHGEQRPLRRLHRRRQPDLRRRRRHVVRHQRRHRRPAVGEHHVRARARPPRQRAVDRHRDARRGRRQHRLDHPDRRGAGRPGLGGSHSRTRLLRPGRQAPDDDRRRAADGHPRRRPVPRRRDAAAARARPRRLRATRHEPQPRPAGAVRVADGAQQRRRRHPRHRHPARHRPSGLQPRRLRRGRTDAAAGRCSTRSRCGGSSSRPTPGSSVRSASSAPTSSTPTTAAPTRSSTPTPRPTSTPSSPRWKPGCWHAPARDGRHVRRSCAPSTAGSSARAGRPRSSRCRPAPITAAVDRHDDRVVPRHLRAPQRQPLPRLPRAGRHVAGRAGRADGQGRPRAACRPASATPDAGAHAPHSHHLYGDDVVCTEYERGALRAGDVVSGPAVIREPMSTTFVPADRTLTTGEFGELVIH